LIKIFFAEARSNFFASMAEQKPGNK